MDKKKLGKQLAVIALLIVLFAGLDLAIYQLFIKRALKWQIMCLSLAQEMYIQQKAQ